MRFVPVAFAAALAATPAFAGVPEKEVRSSGKWHQVNNSWIIDTEDVEIRGDQLRFWVERVAVGVEVASTQGLTAWKGKIRLRCGDFHQKLEGEVRNALGNKFYISYDGWEKIKPHHFAYTLASNFCYITKTPGYTPEPVVYEWQEKLTAALKAAPVKKPRNETCNRSRCP